MIKRDKELIVVGDRVLVRVEEGEERTNVGLYLPSTAIDNQAVQGGTIVATGPGLPMPSPDSLSDEPWRTPDRITKFVPMQARKGDYALFFR
ncbi:MAG TPA: co-chaperone GroES family protein, partial [Gemmatimonadaceae bacterium]